MSRPNLADLDAAIALARIGLSVATIASIYIDPTVPDLAAWMRRSGAPFVIDRYALAVLIVHLAAASTLYFAIWRGIQIPRFGTVTKMFDVGFAIAIAVFTEGPTSPSYAFFTFAIVAVGCREGFRATLLVTFCAVGLYLGMLLLLLPPPTRFYIMRPVYLAITGYVVAFLAERRVSFERRIRVLEAAAERRGIARSLHDGYLQVLAGARLRLEACRRLIARGDSAAALTELDALESGVSREYEGVRTWIRALGEVRGETTASGVDSSTRFTLRTDLAANAADLEQIFWIMLEGLRNTVRHANARNGAITAVGSKHGLVIAIEDDGVGFPEESPPPWTIASRVEELGGDVRIVRNGHRGSRLEIDTPLLSR